MNVGGEKKSWWLWPAAIVAVLLGTSSLVVMLNATLAGVDWPAIITRLASVDDSLTWRRFAITTAALRGIIYLVVLMYWSEIGAWAGRRWSWPAEKYEEHAHQRWLFLSVVVTIELVGLST